MIQTCKIQKRQNAGDFWGDTKIALFNDTILCQDNAASVAGEHSMRITH